MRILDAITLFLTLLMCGNELTVSLFINPAIWRRDDQGLLSELAQSLGKFMPFWYGACLFLMGIESYLRRGEAGRALLIGSCLLWTIIIVYTVLVLVPINNRLATNSGGDAAPDWKQQSKHWDSLHRIRIALLLVAVSLFYFGISH